MLRDGNVEYKRGIEDDLGDLFVLGFFFAQATGRMEQFN